MGASGSVAIRLGPSTTISAPPILIESGGRHQPGGTVMDVFRALGKVYQNRFSRDGAGIEEVIPELGPACVGGAVQSIDIELMNKAIIAEGAVDRAEFGGIDKASGDR